MMELYNRLCKRFSANHLLTGAKVTRVPVTLAHVAHMAGVSPSTASRALAGKARQFRISEKTAQAVLRAAKDLGFQASHVARSLRTQRTGLIGLLVPDASNPFFAAIARKATIYAERHGLSTLLADSHDSIDHERELLVHLQSRQVEGLIICPIGDASDHLATLERNVNVVVVDRWFTGVRLTAVTSENERGAQIATSALLDKGHRTIGCLLGRPGTSTNIERLQGYRLALKARGIKFNPALVHGDDFSEVSGYHSTCALLDMHKDLTAIFAFGNQNALGALRALSQRKLAIPRDVSLVSFDDSPFAEYLASPLSVVRQDVEAIGCRAAELLVEQIHTGRKPRKQLHRLPVEFLLRDSISAPRIR